MTTQLAATTGVDGFVAGLEGYGLDPQVTSGLVTYTVTPVTGALAGRLVRTGVILHEITPWPAAPPHWIHLPQEITFPQTNVGGSPMPGWVGHSRDIQAWGTASTPIAAWLAHVRGVLSGAV